MLRVRTIAILTVFVLAGAVVHGAITQRWGTLSPNANRTAAMHDLVVQFPECESSPIDHDVPLKERSVATSRRYLSPANGFAATTSIISGVPGAVATHTPDVCYTASGYTMLRNPQRQTMTLPNGGTATVYVADFEKLTATQSERLRIRWAWSVRGEWDAPDRPRFHYLRTPELFKLYVVTTLKDGDEPPSAPAFAAAVFEQYGAVLQEMP